ncbi:MAG: NAD(P)/FAD-dependent oxidoreductase, partial [Polyangiales bacterium]
MSGRCDVAIVGGGPVGLLLGCQLAQRGVAVRVLERELQPSTSSRAIGIHPPGLRCLAEVGVAEASISRGVCIQRALAFGDRRSLGGVSFTRVSGAYPFVLSLPQSETERVLSARLHELEPSVLQRGVEVTHVDDADGGSVLRLRSRADDALTNLHARFVVGCDGKHSCVREAAGIAYAGAPYQAHFVMVDTPDETPLGAAAAVFLGHAGLVESFPLPERLRRWVVAVTTPDPDPDPDQLARVINQRTGQRANCAAATMLSAFTAEHFLAACFARRHIALAGDAAHVLSPIGGQGMNLGWLDARQLAPALVEALARPAQRDLLLGRYAAITRRAARSATRRA